MEYFSINGINYSMYVNKLKVTKEHKYKGATNASGNTVVKYVNTKRTIEVGIIPLDDSAMRDLQAVLNEFKVTISYRDPETGNLEEAVCILPKNSVEYYTIQANNTKFKAFFINFQEL